MGYDLFPRTLDGNNSLTGTLNPRGGPPDTKKPDPHRPGSVVSCIRSLQPVTPGVNT
jgi:hypothetical protein